MKMTAVLIVAFASSFAAAECSVGESEKPTVTLVKLDTAEWKRVSKAPEEVEAEVYSAAWVYGTHQRRKIVITSSIAGDIEEESRYCFDDQGKLEELHFEAETAWGWGYKRDITYRPRKESHEQFFDLGTKRPLKPSEAGKDAWIKEHIKEYGSLADLPFFSLLTTKSAKDHAPSH